MEATLTFETIGQLRSLRECLEWGADPGNVRARVKELLIYGLRVEDIIIYMSRNDGYPADKATLIWAAEYTK